MDVRCSHSPIPNPLLHASFLQALNPIGQGVKGTQPDAGGRSRTQQRVGGASGGITAIGGMSEELVNLPLVSLTNCRQWRDLPRLGRCPAPSSRLFGLLFTAGVASAGWGGAGIV